jgi:hypothetical protein
MAQIRKYSDIRQGLWLRVIAKCKVWTSMMCSHPLLSIPPYDFALFSCNEGFRVEAIRC